MTQRQTAAISNPCYRATETYAQRFWARVGNWSTILTVNK